jgi:hypothetical protein
VSASNPCRIRPRGKRRVNVETPTRQQIWQTAPGDFAESVLAAIGMMAVPAMLFIGFGAFVAFQDIPDMIIATGVCAGVFAIEGAFNKWRGRSMFDPPGQVRKAEQAEAEQKASTETSGIEIGSDATDADEA